MSKEVIFHIDDIWSSVKANDASKVLFDKWITKSGSIMVPCSAFEDAVKKFKNDLTLDLWIHLTITSEWDFWFEKRKPTLPVNKVKSLVWKDWFFHKTINDVFLYAKEDEIKKELINQINIAKESWITLSHIDSHMWVLLHKKLFHIYKEISKELKIQPFIIHPKEYYKEWHWFFKCEKDIKQLSESWFKVFDHIESNSINKSSLYSQRCFEERLLRIKKGTTYFLLHVLSDWDYKISPDALERFNEFVFFSDNNIFDRFKKLWISQVRLDGSKL